MTKEEDIKIMVDRLSFQWENSKQLCKPETKCLYQAIQIQKLSRENEKHFIMALIKRENLTSRKVIVHEVLHAYSVLVLQKRCLPIEGFFSLKMSAKAEKY